MVVSAVIDRTKVLHIYGHAAPPDRILRILDRHRYCQDMESEPHAPYEELRELAYAAIGLGVVAAQRLRVAARDIDKQVGAFLCRLAEQQSKVDPTDD